MPIDRYRKNNPLGKTQPNHPPRSRPSPLRRSWTKRRSRRTGHRLDRITLLPCRCGLCGRLTLQSIHPESPPILDPTAICPNASTPPKTRQRPTPTASIFPLVCSTSSSIAHASSTSNTSTVSLPTTPIPSKESPNTNASIKKPMNCPPQNQPKPTNGFTLEASPFQAIPSG